jgi:hypothetical protein
MLPAIMARAVASAFAVGGKTQSCRSPDGGFIDQVCPVNEHHGAPASREPVLVYAEARTASIAAECRLHVLRQQAASDTQKSSILRRRRAEGAKRIVSRKSECLSVRVFPMSLWLLYRHEQEVGTGDRGP